LNFLRYYSFVVIVIGVTLCLFAAEEVEDLLSGILFLPVVVYLWQEIVKDIKKKNISKKNNTK